MIERCDGFAKFHILGPEEDAAGDRDAIINDHARGQGEVRERLQNRGAVEIIEYARRSSSPIKITAGSGVIAKKPGRPGKG